MKKVYLVELRTLEPVCVVSKKGKTSFVAGSKYIPASSIVGAVARKIVLNNINESIGNCKNINSLEKLPDCSNCKEENCPYKRLWVDGDIKLTNAVIGKWILSSPGIPDLQTVCEPRSGDYDKKDQLLFMFLEGMFWKGSVRSDRVEEVRKIGWKKSSATFDGQSFVDVPTIQLTRVKIEERLKTSEKEMLYGFTAIKDNQDFRLAVYCDEDVAKAFEGKIRVGAWKSRGMGLVKLTIAEEFDEDSFITKRENEIERGFEKISEILNVDGFYGTYTYLTAGTEDLKAEKVLKVERRVKSIRYQRKQDGSHFVLANVAAPGSAGVFEITEQNAETLARLELKKLKHPWFDWVFFNHPVHYENSILEVEGDDR